MPLQAHHERKASPAGTPMRRFRDMEPGDTFAYRDMVYMKSADGRAYLTTPEPSGDGWIELPPDEWVCEF